MLSDALPERQATTPPSVCRVCGKGPTIKSHLIPEAFVREIFHDPKVTEHHMVVHNGKDYKQASQTGIYDRNILCKDCDNLLGKYENSAISTFRKLRPIKISKVIDGNVVIKEKGYPFRVLVENEIVRFACGILWKYASIQPNNPGFIKIGDYREICQKICFEGADIPNEIDVFLERDISAHAHKVDVNEVYYYSTPSVGILDDCRMAWFNAGGFFVYIRIDKDGPSKYASKRCWLKNRKSCYFNVNLRALSHFEEIAKSMTIAKPNLDRLNKRMDFELRSRSYKNKQ